MSSLLSSFFGYFSYHANSPVPSSTSITLPNGQNGETESLILDVLEIYGKLKARDCLKPCDEVDGLFGRLVDSCILNRNSDITNQVRSTFCHLFCGI